MSYLRYRGDAATALAATGWDAWADDYGALGRSNPVYALTKELLHEMVDDMAPSPPDGGPPWVLDFHCGAGDDLARFLARGWNATGCDGSPGMLRAAASRCASEQESGRLELWLGRAEDLAPASFGRRFDLIFSTTGGFAFLDDAEFVRVHRLLASMLEPHGRIVMAHLTPGCAAESLFHLLHLRPRRGIQRWRGRVPVTVRGEQLLMRLRSPAHIRRLLTGVMRVERVAPLLCFTPPFQSGFIAGPRALAVLKVIERHTAGCDLLASLADQAVCFARPLESSVNNPR